MKVLICSALSHGHLNMSLRIGRELQSRGHEVAAVCNSMYEPVIRNNGLQPIVFQEPTSSKLGNDLHVTCLANSFQKPKSLRVGDEAEVLKHVCLYQQTMDSEYARLFEEYAPDIILQDHIIPCPAVIKSGRPWVRLLSCNPLYLDVADLPPAITAARTDAGRMQLNVERAKRNNLLQPVHKLLQQWMCDHDLPAIDFFSHFYSPNLNFYIYPKEVDYFDEESVKMPGNVKQFFFFKL